MALNARRKRNCNARSAGPLLEIAAKRLRHGSGMSVMCNAQSRHTGFGEPFMVRWHIRARPHSTIRLLYVADQSIKTAHYYAPGAVYVQLVMVTC